MAEFLWLDEVFVRVGKAVLAKAKKARDASERVFVSFDKFLCPFNAEWNQKRMYQKLSEKSRTKHLKKQSLLSNNYFQKSGNNFSKTRLCYRNISKHASNFFIDISGVNELAVILTNR